MISEPGSPVDVDFLDGLPASVRDAFLGSAQTRDLPADSMIFGEGAPARSVFVLTAGFAKMVQTAPNGARVIVRYLRPGEAFGAPGSRQECVYPAEAVTVTRSTCLQWSVQRVRELFLGHPRAAQNALEALEAQLRDMEARLREMSNDPVEHRMAKALARLVERLETGTPEGFEVPFPFSRQDLADLTGTTLHTVSRTLSLWEGRCWIRRGRRHLVITDLPALAGLAQRAPNADAQPRRTHRRAS